MKRLILTLILLLSACQQEMPIYNSRFLAFGTVTHISIIGVSLTEAQAAIAAVERDFTEMQQIWHAWQPSPLTYTNRMLQSGERFAVPPSVLPLLKQAKILAERSEQLFNPAIGKLIQLWGFHRSELSAQKPPPPEKIAELIRANPNMNDIQIEGIYAHCRNPAVQLDFGGIGKGYGIDLAVQRLKSMGIKNAIINAGGDLRAIGSRSNRPWRIAIRSPSGSGTLGFIQVMGDESVFTSGNYERNYIWQGQFYHHIIDPRTGYPAQGLKSVTVVHDNATEADAIATALLIAGPQDWYRVAKKMGARYVLVIDDQNRLHMNPAMAGRVQLLGNDYTVKISPSLEP